MRLSSPRSISASGSGCYRTTCCSPLPASTSACWFFAVAGVRQPVKTATPIPLLINKPGHRPLPAGRLDLCTVLGKDKRPVSPEVRIEHRQEAALEDLQKGICVAGRVSVPRPCNHADRDLRYRSEHFRRVRWPGFRTVFRRPERANSYRRRGRLVSRAIALPRLADAAADRPRLENDREAFEFLILSNRANCDLRHISVSKDALRTCDTHNLCQYGTMSPASGSTLCSTGFFG